jgi:hypothetical protein
MAELAFLELAERSRKDSAAAAVSVAAAVKAALVGKSFAEDLKAADFAAT